MFQGFKNRLKSFLSLSKYEQRGIVVLLGFIAIVSAMNFLIPLTLHHKIYTNKEFQKEVLRFAAARKRLLDSLNIVKLQNNKQLTFEQAKAKLHPFPFDPNHLTTGQGIKLGLTLKQIRQIQRYVDKGGKFRKKEDFKKIYGISNTVYEILVPYMDLPTANSKLNTKNKAHTKQITISYGSLEINTCDTSQLMDQLHLNPWLARRIIKYRKLLGNYYSVNQLKEVYGLKGAVFHKIKPYLTCDTSLVHKIDLNRASFKTLVHHPYLHYNITKRIVNSRKRFGGFRDIIELKSIPGITDSIYRKIKHYLYIAPITK